MAAIPSLSVAATARSDPTFHYDLSNAIYGQFPTCATDISPRRSRAASPASVSNPSKKRKTMTGTTNTTNASTNSTLCRQAISLNRANTPPTWLPQPKQRSPLVREQGMNIHASTCLNLNAASEESSESDLWILPELDDWEENEPETETPALSHSSSSSSSLSASLSSPASVCVENKWAAVLRRAADSNLQRLRTRMEGEGWDFVKPANHDDDDVGGVDEDFDCVVLARG